MSNRMFGRSIVGFSSLLLAVGCGGSGGSAQSASDVKCPPGQTFDGQYCQVDQSVATAEQPAADEPPAKPAHEVPEEKGATPSEESEDPAKEEEVDEEEIEPVDEAPDTPAKATPVDVTMAAQAAPLVQYLASSHLPSGARPLGAPFAGQFAEGQVLERKVQLSAGKCYTVVGAALPPVGEVNIELFPEGAKEPVSKDTMAGLQAVLGSRDTCFKPSESGAYRLVLTVEKGQGIAAAQVFAK